MRNVVKGVAAAVMFTVGVSAWGQIFCTVKWGATVAEVKKAYPGLRKTTEDDKEVMPRTNKIVGLYNNDVYMLDTHIDAGIALQYFGFSNNKLTYIVIRTTAARDARTMLQITDSVMEEIRKRYGIVNIKMDSQQTELTNTRLLIEHYGEGAKGAANIAVAVVLLALTSHQFSRMSILVPSILQEGYVEVFDLSGV